MVLIPKTKLEYYFGEKDFQEVHHGFGHLIELIKQTAEYYRKTSQPYINRAEKFSQLLNMQRNLLSLYKALKPSLPEIVISKDCHTDAEIIALKPQAQSG